MAVRIIYTNAYGNSIEFSKNSGIRVTSIDGLTSNEVDLSEATVTNQVGSSITGVSIQPKDMTIEGRYKYTPETRKNLLAVMLPGIKGTLRYINDVDNVDVYWEGQPTKTPEITSNPVWQSFQVTLRFPYPFPRNTTPKIVRFSGLTSNFKFKQSYSSTEDWTISDKERTHIKVITNKGTREAGFTITFEAMTDKIIAPSVINVDTREHITFSALTLSKGDVLTVCTKEGERGATLQHEGTESNVFYLMDYDSTFFLLNIGDNTIRTGATQNEDNLAIVMSFDESLAGV